MGQISFLDRSKFVRFGQKAGARSIVAEEFSNTASHSLSALHSWQVCTIEVISRPSFTKASAIGPIWSRFNILPILRALRSRRCINDMAFFHGSSLLVHDVSTSRRLSDGRVFCGHAARIIFGFSGWAVTASIVGSFGQ